MAEKNEVVVDATDAAHGEKLGITVICESGNEREDERPDHSEG
jgi:hypothetical protein